MNGVRFLAATVVVCSHVELMKALAQLPNLWLNRYFHSAAVEAVNMLFVVSGFLITYLLLVEQRRNGTIDVKKFYIRRALRVQPVYLLIVVLAFFAAPWIPVVWTGPFSHVLISWNADLKTHYAANLILYLLLCPHVATAIFTPVNYAAQAWSIGVEEQFYAVWPWLMKRGERMLPRLLIGIVAVKFVIDNLIVRPMVHASGGKRELVILLNFLNYFRVECLAIGGLAAYGVLFYPERTRWLIKPAIQWLAVPLFFALIATGERVPWAAFLWSSAYAVLLINIGASRIRILNLETSWLDWLGRVSYGIYMYHLIVLAIALKTCEVIWRGELLHYFTAAPWATNAGLYLSVMAGTLALAGISYHFFELKFLALKGRFGSLSKESRAPALPHA